MLILLTVKAYQNAPPIPGKFVNPTGAVVFTADDVIAGQQVFLKHGLMDNGTFGATAAISALIFPHSPCTFYRQYQGFPQPPDVKLVGVSFLDSICFVPLQAADMFAWEFYTHSRQLLAAPDDVGPRPHAKQFFDTGRFFMGLIDRATCEQIANATPISQA